MFTQAEVQQQIVNYLASIEGKGIPAATVAASIAALKALAK